MRAGRHLRNPFARRVSDLADAGVGRNAQHLAIFAAGNQAFAIGIADAGEHAVMGFANLLAAIQPVKRAGGIGEEGDIT